MKRFEYKLLEVPIKGWLGKVDNDALLEQLNQAGRQGWEVITVGNTYKYENSSRPVIIILKKEIQ